MAPSAQVSLPKGRGRSATTKTYIDTEVTLTEDDLEKIAEVVTVAFKDQWASLEEQQKAVVEALQSGLHALQLKADTL